MAARSSAPGPRRSPSRAGLPRRARAAWSHPAFSKYRSARSNLPLLGAPPIKPAKSLTVCPSLVPRPLVPRLLVRGPGPRRAAVAGMPRGGMPGPELLADGLPVVAPAVPNRSLLGDAAYVASVIRQIDGPVILVGHSYGGAVITVAGIEPNVRALV